MIEEKISESKNTDKKNSSEYNLKPTDTKSILSRFKDFKYEPSFCVPTGFKQFDGFLKGGFPDGLHILSAKPSKGKTTLCTQMADQGAQSGIDVLYISLEMNPQKLISQSISRHLYLKYGEQTTSTSTGKHYLAKSAYDIRTHRYADSYSSKEKEAIENAISEYEQYCSRITYYDREIISRKNKGYEGFKHTLANYAKTHERFLVIIDYIQILSFIVNDRVSDKQRIDEVVYNLKDFSYKFGVPVLAISSSNRNSYDDEGSMQAFNGSSSLDFTADSLFYLQNAGMDFSTEDKSEIKRKARTQILENSINRQQQNPFIGVPLQMKILKNRDNCKGDIFFNAKLGFSYFEEIDKGSIELPSISTNANPVFDPKKKKAV